MNKMVNLQNRGGRSMSNLDHRAQLGISAEVTKIGHLNCEIATQLSDRLDERVNWGVSAPALGAG